MFITGGGANSENAGSEAPLMAENRVSIALAAFNGEEFLAAQLASIGNQSLLPYELVVADDASEDRTTELVEEFARKVSFPVRLLRSDERLGLFRNFERAIEACSGDFILLCDQDDVWLEQKVEEFARALAGPAEIVACFADAELVDRQLEPLGITLWEKELFLPRERAYVHDGRLLEVLLRHNVVQGASLGFKKSLLQTILPFPQTLDSKIWVHDGWIALCAAVTGRMAMIDRSLMLYRIHGGNLLGNATRPQVVKKGPAWLATKIRDVLFRGHRPIGPDSNSWQSLQSIRAHWITASEILLGRIDPGPSANQLRSLVHDKLEHDSNRLKMAMVPKRPRVVPWQRLVLIGSELAAGRYHRWAEGYVSVFRDILQR
jgi:glycosyltransferase involved in cell wall biosynthesis